MCPSGEVRDGIRVAVCGGAECSILPGTSEVRRSYVDAARLPVNDYEV